MTTEAGPKTGRQVTQTGSIVTDIEGVLAHWKAGYQLGRSVGYDDGYAAGAADAGERLTAAITGCTSAWSSPSQQELRERRNDPPITRPCSKKCRVCIVCMRYKQWWRESRVAS